MLVTQSIDEDSIGGPDKKINRNFKNYNFYI